ncbi:hypothetical protein BH11BAC4_BH11BAC4_18420 [soil metagenome]
MKKNIPFPVYLLLNLIIFLAVGGIYGGGMLMADPSGNRLGLGIILLLHSPFDNYILPGIIFIMFNGFIPLFICYALLFRPPWKWPGIFNIYKDQYWPWTGFLYSGLIGCIWIDVPLLMIGFPGSIQGYFGLLGIAIVIITLLPANKNFYSVNS